MTWCRTSIERNWNSSFASNQVQLLFTVACVSLFAFEEASRQFAEENVWLTITATIIGFSALIVISCCEGVRHTSPHNFIYLAVSTVALSYVVGACTVYMNPMLVSSFHSMIIQNINQTFPTDFASRWTNSNCCDWSDGVCTANQMGIHIHRSHTVGVRSAIRQCWCDHWTQRFRQIECHSFDCIRRLHLFVRSFPDLWVCCSFHSNSKLLTFFWSTDDVYMIMEGERDAPYQLSPDEYVSGAVILFMDIIWLFMILLKLLSLMTKNKNQTRGRNARRTNFRWIMCLKMLRTDPRWSVESDGWNNYSFRKCGESDGRIMNRTTSPRPVIDNTSLTVFEL